MSSEFDQITRLIVRLIGLTNSKKIIWQRKSPDPELAHDRHYLNYVYIAQIDVDIFRLSEFEIKTRDEGQYNWTRDVALEIIDPSGRTLWRCPPNPAIRDLFRIAARAAADIDGVMARLESFAQAS